MSDNIIQIGNVTAIINGGNPLEGCPKDWDEAKAIEIKLNEGKEEFNEPIWKFDCGFKLDFDGPILKVSSRFYPPKTHYGATWGGRVTITMFGKTIADKKFDCKTLDELSIRAELFVKEFSKKLTEMFLAE